MERNDPNTKVKEKIYKETVTVVSATVCLGVVIALFDLVLQYGMKLLVG